MKDIYFKHVCSRLAYSGFFREALGHEIMEYQRPEHTIDQRTQKGYPIEHCSSVRFEVNSLISFIYSEFRELFLADLCAFFFSIYILLGARCRIGAESYMMS